MEQSSTAVASPTGGQASPPSDLAVLEKRIAALERTAWHCPPDKILDSEMLSQMRRARSAVESSKCYSCHWKWVPTGYYKLDLSQRRDVLGASSTYQLCKSMLMENRACDDTVDCRKDDPTNSRFYLVVVQYEAAINAKKLASEVRALRPAGPKRIEPSKFEFRLASEADNDALTGYVHNSVTPFGLLAKDRVPIVLAKEILQVEPAYVWMGGGHVDLKLGVSVSEFVRATGAIVADVSDARSGGVEEE